jgi:hypothetical protein
VTYQLRIYEIEEGALEGFMEEWRRNVAPLRRRFGFEIVGAWAVQEASQFVWIIGHDDFAGADKAYYDSSERAAMDPDPRRLILETDTRLMSEITQS